MTIEMSRLCVPFTPLARPLGACRVALVSTAGVYAAGQEPFDPDNDVSIRVVPSDTATDALRVSHGHYDHASADRDPNVVFPLDRLRELAAAGEIGELAPGAVSMGFTQSFRVVRDETTPRIVDEVNRWSVDACVLTAG
ncbi:MAG TPA: glycine/sarcosine/betaine reductase selenoprotein B family protein [Thermodesulfobacteriota bacterium]